MKNKKHKSHTPYSREWTGRSRSIEVFDFRKNWHLVRRHLPRAEEALKRCMLMFLVENGFKHPAYNPKKGPWSYSTGPQWDEYRAEQTDRAIERGEFKWELPAEHESERTAEKKWHAYFKFGERFNPKPGTLGWYQLYGGCHWLVPWLMILGRQMFPGLVWIPVLGKFHSFAGGMDRNGRLRVIFDILYFEEMTAEDLFAFVCDNRPPFASAAKRGARKSARPPELADVVCLATFTPNILAAAQ